MAKTAQETTRDLVKTQNDEPVEEVDLIELVDHARKFTAVLGRPDLAGRLAQTRSRLLDPNVRVLVVGQFKQGKSKLVNALVSAPACPVDDDIATSVPTSVGYAEKPGAAILVRPEGHPDSIERVPIELSEIAEYVSEKGNPDNERDIVGAEVLLPREILKGGLHLVDSPGVGGLESTRSLSTLAALSSAHAMLLVSDASQEYTAPEVQFLQHAMRVSPNVAAVLSKTDIYPEWRQIEQLDRGHLGNAGADVPIFSVSSDLRMLAAEEQDRELNDESGFPALVQHLRTKVLGNAETINRRSAIHDLRSVVDQLGMSIQSELNALLHPEDTPHMIAQLEEAKARADEFRGRSSRWQVMLSDGVADLIADTEHDLRDRLRKVQREAEAAIDEGDPGPIWDKITEWLDKRVADAVSETFVWTNERSRWLSEQVAEQFAADEGAIPLVEVDNMEGVLDPVEMLQNLDEGRLGTMEKMYIGVRGSYGGVLMAGLATSLVGLTLLNPLSLLVGIVVGRRAFKEDMGNRLSRRQMEAKNNIRRHVDDVVFQVGKQLKDRLRLVQRVARDHFGKIADELHRSLSDSVLAAKKSATTYASDRDGRVEQLQLRSRQLSGLRARIPELPPLAEGAGR